MEPLFTPTTLKHLSVPTVTSIMHCKNMLIKHRYQFKEIITTEDRPSITKQ